MQFQLTQSKFGSTSLLVFTSYISILHYSTTCWWYFFITTQANEQEKSSDVKYITYGHWQHKRSCGCIAGFQGEDILTRDVLKLILSYSAQGKPQEEGCSTVFMKEKKLMKLAYQLDETQSFDDGKNATGTRFQRFRQNARHYTNGKKRTGRKQRSLYLEALNYPCVWDRRQNELPGDGWS